MYGCTVVDNDMTGMLGFCKEKAGSVFFARKVITVSDSCLIGQERVNVVKPEHIEISDSVVADSVVRIAIDED